MIFDCKTVDNYDMYIANVFETDWNGSKYPGHFGITKDYTFVDYWTLRRRSLQLFTENPYCRGIIRRILRNEIFTGVVPDAQPLAGILWPELDETEREEKSQEYGEKMNAAFSLYANNYEMFDFRKQLTFGEWQNQVRMEAMLSGDGIIVSRINPQTGLPMWDWINGYYVRTPETQNIAENHLIKNGVEIDENGRHIAYYVQNVREGKTTFERIPVKGRKSGRQIAWMVYGSERLIDDTRGEPLLSGVLGILKELDRYRDAEERAAVVNAMLAFFIKKSPTAGVGSHPTAALADLKTPGSLTGTKPLVTGSAVNPDAPRPELKVMQPGTTFDLNNGEDVQSFQTNRPNVNYAAFEQAILDAVCWSLEIPPEIVSMKFQSSYSASRQANNEFDVYLKYRTFKNAKDFCQIVYEEFIIQSCLYDNLDLPGFLSVIMDSTRWKERAAWLSCAWTGINRPAVDRQKDVTASILALDAGLTTYDIEARRTSGLSFRQVMAQQAREKKQMNAIDFTPKPFEDNNGRPVYDADGNIIPANGVIESDNAQNDRLKAIIESDLFKAALTQQDEE